MNQMETARKIVFTINEFSKSQEPKIEDALNKLENHIHNTNSFINTVPLKLENEMRGEEGIRKEIESLKAKVTENKKKHRTYQDTEKKEEEIEKKYLNHEKIIKGAFAGVENRLRAATRDEEIHFKELESRINKVIASLNSADDLFSKEQSQEAQVSSDFSSMGKELSEVHVASLKAGAYELRAYLKNTYINFANNKSVKSIEGAEIGHIMNALLLLEKVAEQKLVPVIGELKTLQSWEESLKRESLAVLYNKRSVVSFLDRMKDTTERSYKLARATEKIENSAKREVLSGEEIDVGKIHALVSRERTIYTNYVHVAMVLKSELAAIKSSMGPIINNAAGLRKKAEELDRIRHSLNAKISGLPNYLRVPQKILANAKISFEKHILQIEKMASEARKNRDEARVQQLNNSVIRSKHIVQQLDHVVDITQGTAAHIEHAIKKYK